MVALKVLHGAVDEAEAERFAREARMLSAQHHPGIVACLDHGLTDCGQRFLVMEWFEGEDLAQRLLRGALTVRKSVQLMIQVADALASAHARGIVHRDIKPGNLFLCPGASGQGEQVKLLDFGIARRLESSHELTVSGVIIGTPEYMAPEQVHGLCDLSTATDLFSAGCVLYACLTGESPFAAEHLIAVLVRILFEEPVPITERRADVPAELGELLCRLLAKDPAARPPDAEALRRALLAIAELPLSEALPLPQLRWPPPGAFAKKEQSLVSVVLAAPPRASGTADPRHVTAERQQILQELERLGVTAYYLANQTLVVTVSMLESARDQATLAARAALLIKELWPAARVAMATGRGSLQGRAAVGHVVLQAAQSLQTLGAALQDETPGGVWVDPLSAQLLSGRFSLTHRSDGTLFTHEVKEDDQSRLLLGRPTPCVGRDMELLMMEAQLKSCIGNSEARALLFTAPPGAGKSRLHHEFRRRVDKRSEPITVLLGRGDLVSAGSPYGILRSAIHRLCDISGGESMEKQRERLDKRIGLHLRPEERDRVVVFLGELCDVPFSDVGRPMLQAARQDPLIMRHGLSRALRDWVAAECAAAPLLLLLDDLQWSDELTIAAIDQILEEQAGSPLCLLAFARPEVCERFPRLWSRHLLQEFPLKALSKKACQRLAIQVLGSDVNLEQVAHAIAQSGGNALFFEEMLRAVAESKAEGQPETVMAMLQSRVGRLDAGGRRAIRAASIFGERFWRGGVAAVLGLPQSSAAVSSWLATLESAELVQVHVSSRFADEKEYSFRHAMVRDAVYQLLVEEDLLIGHRLAEQYLEQAGERDAMILAEHAQRAGDLERAIPLYLQAASQSFERYDLQGALTCVALGIAANAQGELRGRLRALQFMSEFYKGNMKNTLPLGLEALELLPKGSLWWCRAISFLFVTAIHESEMAILHTLVQSFAQATPSTDALSAYAEAGGWLVAMFGFLGLRDSARGFWQVLKTATETVMDSDANTRGFVKNGHSWYLRLIEPQPFLGVQEAADGARAFSRVENQRGLALILLCLGMSLSELGDPDGAERELRRALALAREQQDYMIIHNAMVYLALFLVRRELPEFLDEADALAQSVLASDMSSKYCGMCRLVHAHSSLQRGDFTRADAEARRAASLVAPMWPYQLDAQAISIGALLGLGQTRAARVLAESSLQSLDALGGLGYSEVPLRLAATEAFLADGELATARATLRETIRQLDVRRATIPDSSWRERFTTAVPPNKKALALAAIWLQDAPQE